MMPPSHKQGIAIILGAGGPPHPMGGEGPDGDDMQIPIPDGFDMGDSKPGDTLTVQVECKVSPDGKSLIPLSVDGHKLDSDEESQPPDDGDDMGDKWQEMFGKK